MAEGGKDIRSILDKGRQRVEAAYGSGSTTGASVPGGSPVESVPFSPITAPVKKEGFFDKAGKKKDEALEATKKGMGWIKDKFFPDKDAREAVLAGLATSGTFSLIKMGLRWGTGGLGLAASVGVGAAGGALKSAQSEVWKQYNQEKAVYKQTIEEDKKAGVEPSQIAQDRLADMENVGRLDAIKRFRALSTEQKKTVGKAAIKGAVWGGMGGLVGFEVKELGLADLIKDKASEAWSDLGRRMIVEFAAGSGSGVYLAYKQMEHKINRGKKVSFGEVGVKTLGAVFIGGLLGVTFGELLTDPAHLVGTHSPTAPDAPKNITPTRGLVTETPTRVPTSIATSEAPAKIIPTSSATPTEAPRATITPTATPTEAARPTLGPASTATEAPRPTSVPITEPTPIPKPEAASLPAIAPAPDAAPVAPPEPASGLANHVTRLSGKDVEDLTALRDDNIRLAQESNGAFNYAKELRAVLDDPNNTEKLNPFDPNMPVVTEDAVKAADYDARVKRFEFAQSDAKIADQSWDMKHKPGMLESLDENAQREYGEYQGAQAYADELKAGDIGANGNIISQDDVNAARAEAHKQWEEANSAIRNKEIVEFADTGRSVSPTPEYIRNLPDLFQQEVDVKPGSSFWNSFELPKEYYANELPHGWENPLNGVTQEDVVKDMIIKFARENGHPVDLVRAGSISFNELDLTDEQKNEIRKVLATRNVEQYLSGPGRNAFQGALKKAA